MAWTLTYGGAITAHGVPVLDHYQICAPGHPAHEAGVSVAHGEDPRPEALLTLRRFEERPSMCPKCFGRLRDLSPVYNACVLCGWTWVRPMELTEVAV